MRVRVYVYVCVLSTSFVIHISQQTVRVHSAYFTVTLVYIHMVWPSGKSFDRGIQSPKLACWKGELSLCVW